MLLSPRLFLMFFRGALTCPTYLEHFELNDTTIEDGRSHFPAPATGPTSDHFPCCDQLGGRSPGDHLSSEVCQFFVGDALQFRSPMLPPSRLACSLSTPPVLGTLDFSPDRSSCSDCLLRFSRVPDPRLIPASRLCWDTGVSNPQQPVRPCGTGAFDNAVPLP